MRLAGAASPTRAALLAATIAVLATAPSGDGAWAMTGSGSGSIGSKTMPAGNTPTASAALTNVTVSWTASQFASGGNVPGYVVKRYNAFTNALQTTLANCSGIVAATSCTENNVPPGSWKYSVTPAAGGWRGTESAQSSSVLVL
jgi:hypothetical protein